MSENKNKNGSKCFYDYYYYLQELKFYIQNFLPSQLRISSKEKYKKWEFNTNTKATENTFVV